MFVKSNKFFSNTGGCKLLVSILIDTIILSLLYATINWGVSYWKNVIFYTLCYEIKLAIGLGGISFGLFFMSFGLYFIIGLAVVWVLSKIEDAAGPVWFIVSGILVQIVLEILISLVIS